MSSERSDDYITLRNATHGPAYKEKGSKFIGYAFPVKTEEDVKVFLEELKRSHHTASHFCYAYQLGFPEPYSRANDDGEPYNSAGKPILGQLNSAGITDALVVVIRYYGGTKLGVGGLIQAYKTAAKSCLDDAEIVTKTLITEYQLNFEYPLLNRVMRFIKANQLEVIEQQMTERCVITIGVRESESDNIKFKLQEIHGLEVVLP